MDKVNRRNRQFYNNRDFNDPLSIIKQSEGQ